MSDAMEDEKLKAIRERQKARKAVIAVGGSIHPQSAVIDVDALLERLTARPVMRNPVTGNPIGTDTESDNSSLIGLSRPSTAGSDGEASVRADCAKIVYDYAMPLEGRASYGDLVRVGDLIMQGAIRKATAPAAVVTREQAGMLLCMVAQGVTETFWKDWNEQSREQWRKKADALLPLISGATVAVDRRTPGTVEVCSLCGPHQSKYDECQGNGKCPLRIASGLLSATPEVK